MKKYKILKLTNKELEKIKYLIIQEIIDLKRKQNLEDTSIEQIQIYNQLTIYQRILNYISYIER